MELFDPPDVLGGERGLGLPRVVEVGPVLPLDQVLDLAGLTWGRGRGAEGEFELGKVVLVPSANAGQDGGVRAGLKAAGVTGGLVASV